MADFDSTINTLKSYGAAAVRWFKEDVSAFPSPSHSSPSPYPSPSPINRDEIIDIYDPNSVLAAAAELDERGHSELAIAFVNQTLDQMLQLIQANPQDTKLKYSAAVILAAGDNYLEALQQIAWLLVNDWKKETPVAADIEPLLFAASLLDSCSLAEGSATKREEIFQAVLKAEPDNLAAHLGLIALYLEMNSYAQARSEYDFLNLLLQSADPAQAAAYRFEMADLIGDHQGAIDAFDSLPLPAPWDSAAESAFQEMAERLGQILDPRPEFQKVALPLRKAFIQDKLAAVDPETATIAELLAAVDLSLELGDLASARDFQAGAERLNPLSPAVLAKKLELLSRDGRFMEVYELLLQHQQSSRFLAYVIDNLEARAIELEQKRGPKQTIRQLRRAQDNYLKYQYTVYREMSRLFPESVHALQAVADITARFGDGQEISRRAREAALALLPAAAGEDIREIKIRLLRQRLAAGQTAVLDGKPVRLINYDLKTGVADPPVEPLPLGAELMSLLGTKTEIYFTKDQAALRTLVTTRSQADLSSLSLSQAVNLAARIVEAEMTFDVNATQKADVILEPLEQKLAKGDYQKAVCRHYAALFAAIFDLIKAANPRLHNAYVDYSVNPVHAWNTVFVIRAERIDAYVIDTTIDDKDGRFGNNLGGLKNFHN